MVESPNRITEKKMHRSIEEIKSTICFVNQSFDKIMSLVHQAKNLDCIQSTHLNFLLCDVIGPDAKNDMSIRFTLACSSLSSDVEAWVPIQNYVGDQQPYSIALEIAYNQHILQGYRFIIRTPSAESEVFMSLGIDDLDALVESLHSGSLSILDFESTGVIDRYILEVYQNEFIYYIRQTLKANADEVIALIGIMMTEGPPHQQNDNYLEYSSKINKIQKFSLGNNSYFHFGDTYSLSIRANLTDQNTCKKFYKGLPIKNFSLHLVVRNTEVFFEFDSLSCISEFINFDSQKPYAYKHQVH